jgi:hypothetical protein
MIGADFITIRVPMEDGRTVLIEFQHVADHWIVRVADELVLTMPEAVTAALVMAFRELPNVIRAGSES